MTKSGAASLNELHAWFVGGAGVGRKVSLAGPVRLVNRNLLPLSKRDGKETHITNLDRPMMEKSVATAHPSPLSTGTHFLISFLNKSFKIC